MVNLDSQEVKILKQLVRNPRISDNKIGKNTQIPVMTVNRKRKKLEKSGMLSYYADIRHGELGTQDHNAKQLYIIKFMPGITRTEFYKQVNSDPSLKKFYPEHVTTSYLGEKDGHFSLMIVLNAKSEKELIECFNGKIIPNLKKNFGNDSIKEIITLRISEAFRVHHNYLPKINMENGLIKKDWPDDFIFIDKKSFYTEEQRNFLDY